MICTECNSEYQEPVNIPSPIPDKTCAKCGTALTEQKIQELFNALQDSQGTK